MSGLAELAKAALDVLGRSAPWVVIACLSAFGIYKLQELNQANLTSLQSIAEKERNQARDDFSVANKALKDTYEAANKLYTDMMTSMGSSLKQLQALESEVRDKQKAVYQSQVEAERTKAKLDLQQNELTAMQGRIDQARKEIEKARTDSAAAQMAQRSAEVSALQLSSRLEREKSDLEKTSRQLEETKHQVDEKREELGKAIARLKDVSGLVSQVANLPDNPGSERVAELRRKARAALPSIDEFLRNFRDRPLDRRNIDTSFLVGMKTSDLKKSIDAASGFSWYVVFARSRFSASDADVKIVAIPDDQKGKTFLASSIVFRLPGLSREKEETLASQPKLIFDEDLNVSGVEMSSAIIFRCVDPQTLASSMTMRASNFSRSWSSSAKELGAVIPLDEAVGSAFTFTGTARLLKGDAWPQTVHSPDDVLKLVPELIANFPKGSEAGPILCLQFAASRDLLGQVELRVVGLDETERNVVSRDLTQLFRKVFHATQNFLNPPDIVADSSARPGAFISAIARTALLNQSNLPGATPTVSIVATKIDNKITLEVERPNNATDALKRVDPLYVELAENRMKIVPGLVPSK